MATMIASTDNTNWVQVKTIKWMFVCDRCGNSVEFRHGMTTFAIPNDNRSFCSEICVQDVLTKEGK